MVCPAAVSSGSGLDTGSFVRGAGWVPPRSVSIPAGVSRPGGGAVSDALGRTSPSTAPMAATRPASNPGNCEAVAAVPSASGAASAVSRDGAPGFDAPGFDDRQGRAGNDVGRGRSATRRELQLEGQTQAGAFSRICAQMARQKTVGQPVSAKILSRNACLPDPPLRSDSLSFERVVSHRAVGTCRALPFAHGPLDRHRRQWTSSPNGVPRSAGQQHRQCVYRGI